MTSLKLVRALRRRAWIVLACGVLVGLGGYLSTALAREAEPVVDPILSYATRVTFLMKSPSYDPNDRIQGADSIATLAQRITVGEIPTTVAAQLQRDPADVARRVRVTIRPDASTFTVTTFDTTPEASEALARAYTSALEKWVSDEANRIYSERVAKAQKLLEETEARLTVLRADLAKARPEKDVDKIRQLEQEESLNVGVRIRANNDLLAARQSGIPDTPFEVLEASNTIEISSDVYARALAEGATTQNVKTLAAGTRDDAIGTSSRRSALPSGPIARTAGGFLFGILLSSLIVLVIYQLDPRVRTKEEVERQLDLPVVAEIPTLERRAQKLSQLFVRDDPLTPLAESFRRLRSAVEFAALSALDPDRSPNGLVLLVTSPGPSEGKTTTVANLAAVLAESSKRVLVINCDFRRPKVHQFFESDETPRQVHVTTVPGVSLVTHVLDETVVATPAEAVAAQRVIVERARSQFDIIILDTAPLLVTNDATDVMSCADLVLLVSRTGKTTRKAMERAVEILARREAPLMGVVLTGVTEGLDNHYYYYEGSDGYLHRSNRSSMTGSGRGRDKAPRVSDSSKRSTPPSDVGRLDVRTEPVTRGPGSADASR